MAEQGPLTAGRGAGAHGCDCATVGYFIDLSATEEAGDEILLVASYQPGTEFA